MLSQAQTNLLRDIAKVAKELPKDEHGVVDPRILTDPVRNDLVERFVAGAGEAKVRYAGYRDTFAEAEALGQTLGSWDVTTRDGKFLVWQVLAVKGEHKGSFDPRNPDVTTLFLYQTGGWGSDRSGDDEWESEFGGTFSRRDQLDSYLDDFERQALYETGLFLLWKKVVPSTVTCACCRKSAHEGDHMMSHSYEARGRYAVPAKDQFDRDIPPSEVPDGELEHIEFDMPGFTDEEKKHAFDDLPLDVKLRWDEFDHADYYFGAPVVRLRKLGLAKEVSDVLQNTKVPASYYKLIEEAVDAVKTIPAKFRDVPNFSTTKSFHFELRNHFRYVSEAVAWCEARPDRRWYIRYHDSDSHHRWAAWEVMPPTEAETKEANNLAKLSGLIAHATKQEEAVDGPDPDLHEQEIQDMD